MCTLIGTSTNLLVNSIAERSGPRDVQHVRIRPAGPAHGRRRHALFSAARPLAAPGPTFERQLTENYGLGDYITELRVLPESPLIGKTAREGLAEHKLEIDLVELHRGERTLFRPEREPLRRGRRAAPERAGEGTVQAEGRPEARTRAQVPARGRDPRDQGTGIGRGAGGAAIAAGGSHAGRGGFSPAVSRRGARDAPAQPCPARQTRGRAPGFRRRAAAARAEGGHRAAARERKSDRDRRAGRCERRTGAMLRSRSRS